MLRSIFSNQWNLVHITVYLSWYMLRYICPTNRTWCMLIMALILIVSNAFNCEQGKRPLPLKSFPTSTHRRVVADGVWCECNPMQERKQSNRPLPLGTLLTSADFSVVADDAWLKKSLGPPWQLTKEAHSAMRHPSRTHSLLHCS